MKMLTFLLEYLDNCYIPYTITTGDGLDLSQLDLGLRTNLLNNTKDNITLILSAY